MAKDGDTFEQWLDKAKIPQRYRSPQQLAVLEAAFVFLQRAGSDYAQPTHRGAFSVELSIGLEAGPGGTTGWRDETYRLETKQDLFATSGARDSTSTIRPTLR